MQELILKNGYLFDPPNGYTGQRGDVAIQDGRITGVGKIEEEASQTVDVTGLAVTPGLIDFHAHFYHGGTNTALEFYRYLSDGVTNAVDAGSAGDSNIESFIHLLSERERRNVKLYLNLASEGLSCLGDHNENINPKYFNEQKILRICKRYSDLIAGLKLRISAEIATDSQTTSFDALRRGIEIAQRCGLPLSVHMPNFQGELSRLIDILRPGDIFCHVYTPQKGILEDGSVSEEMKRAVQKGIILESACGKGHFGHGLSFEKVLSCCTTEPAKQMGMEGKSGCLKTGAFANIAVLERRQKDIVFVDVKGKEVRGNELIIPVMTILEGEPVYRNMSAF